MQNVSRSLDGQMIEGKRTPVFLPRRNGQFFLSSLEIYQDGRIFCQGINYRTPSSMKMNDLGMDLDELAWTLTYGKIALAVPPGSIVTIDELATLTVSQVAQTIEHTDFLHAVKDILLELNGQPTSSQQCRAAFLHFLENPSREHQEQLWQAYEVVPNHWKMGVLFDVENGDAPITAIIGRDLADIHQDWLEELKHDYAYLYKRM